LKEKRIAEVRSNSPGLKVTVLYYRPTDRVDVLRSLVALGMFVHEIDCGSEGTAWASRNADSDAAVAFVDDSDAHRAVMRVVAQQFRAALAVLPECLANPSIAEIAGDEAVRERAGEFKLIEESVMRIGQLARRRSQGRSDDQMVHAPVFGVVSFRSSHRWLERDGEVVALSPIEHGILRALVSANGRVVPKDMLLRELSRTNELARDGYLKAVVLRIRRKAERLGGDSSLLCSIRGLGYLLKA